MEITRFSNIRNIYFIGIGGISMSGLALVLKNMGYEVSGSDSHASEIVQKLINNGIKVFIGQNAGNIPSNTEAAVYTAAISSDNPEIIEIKKRHLPLIPRSKLLGIIMDKYESSVAVAGTHGKTTTTSMVSQILIDADKDPTISIGGVMPVIDSNIRIGASDYFITEACEYTNSFLELKPTAAIILNIELDHIDYFKDMDEVYESFKGFAANVKNAGAVIINGDIKGHGQIAPGKNIITYGFSKEYDWAAGNIRIKSGETEFELFYKNGLIGTVNMPLPGIHNVSNALAAVAATHFLGVSPNIILESLRKISGVKRRFELKGVRNGVFVYDDYAHHPSEIRATLSAARSRANGNKIWCVFQPHTYTRTKAFLEDFSKSFGEADAVILTDIYAAREKDPGDINSMMLYDKIAAQNKNIVYIKEFGQIAAYLDGHCQSGDMIITMGAGNIYAVGEALIKEEV